MASEDPVVIVGGGIAGMTALYENLKNGIPTVLYEKNAKRLGGVIRTQDAGDKMLDLGAELVDSGHTALIALCKEVGLEPLDTLADAPDEPPKDASGTGEEQAYYLNSKTGAVRSDDELLTPDKDPNKATGLFIPLAEEIRKDYAEMGKTEGGGDWLDKDFNKKLDRMTAQEYLDDKCRKLAAAGTPVDPSVTAAIENAYQCENGRDLKDIPALVFINQLGQGQTGKGIDFSEGFSIFGGSDERYKIPGGTAALIDKLRQRCEEIAQEKGLPAPIRLGQTLRRVSRGADGKTVLLFQSDSRGAQAVKTDYVISALPAPALGAVRGVENLGLSKDQAALLANLQYTHSSKVFFEVDGQPWKDFTVKNADGTKRHVTDSNGNFYGGTIKECWVTGDEELTSRGTSWITCLVGGAENDKYSNLGQLIDAVKQEYARILGKKPASLYQQDGKPLGDTLLYYKAAGGGIGCYASPGIGQGIPLMKMSEDLKGGTSVGGKPVASYVGTWLAGVDRSNATPCLNVGYMEVGVEAAQSAAVQCAQCLMAPRKADGQAPLAAAPATENTGLAASFNKYAPRKPAEIAGRTLQRVLAPTPAGH